MEPSDTAVRLAKLSALGRRLAGMGRYEWPEHGSWSDDQAEDALVTLNAMIDLARTIMPEVAHGEPIVSEED